MLSREYENWIAYDLWNRGVFYVFSLIIYYLNSFRQVYIETMVKKAQCAALMYRVNLYKENRFYWKTANSSSILKCRQEKFKHWIFVFVMYVQQN